MKKSILRCLSLAAVLSRIPLAKPGLVPSYSEEQEEKSSAADDGEDYEKLLSLGEDPLIDGNEVNVLIDKEIGAEVVPVCDGLGILDEADLGKEEQIKVRIRNKESSLLLKAAKDGKEDSLRLYFYQDGNGTVHASSVSMDTAKKEAGVPADSLYSGGILWRQHLLRSGTYRCRKARQELQRLSFLEGQQRDFLPS